jgi:hypothetical protein
MPECFSICPITVRHPASRTGKEAPAPKIRIPHPFSVLLKTANFSGPDLFVASWSGGLLLHGIPAYDPADFLLHFFINPFCNFFLSAASSWSSFISGTGRKSQIRSLIRTISSQSSTHIIVPLQVYRVVGEDNFSVPRRKKSLPSIQKSGNILF